MIQRYKKELETNEELATADPSVIKLMKESFPYGYDYANKVMELSSDLCDSVEGFYDGAFLGDYGCYPFLIVKEVHFEKDCCISDSVVLKSLFDYGSFIGFVSSLHLSNKIKVEIDKDVCSSYQRPVAGLDTSYLKVLTHLIQVFKCLKTHYEYARSITEKFDIAPVGYSYSVKLGKVLTLSYLMKRINRFNKNKGATSGKYLLVCKTFLDDHVVIECQKYNKKGVINRV